ncbi:CVNH domain-containing protein [Iningainema tapete]|uniref:CVNH domain-containing protein n=1 Tax=Iningainema tapete BLCC-T55 TaxID=2748662 RepID=A0A8J7BZX5_9CYAN|nr:CVNH domain-containing protein [Iningainema tapete]MBD2778667.1 CVNH domain-containing protein [Iningainema tapete BLCC-T55]
MLRKFPLALKSICILAFLLLAAFLITPDAALAGGFKRTCEGIRVTGALLQARCARANGEKVSAQLNLSDGIANRDGRLAWSLGGGGFERTCRSIKYPVLGLLGAVCGDGRGGESSTAINIDEKISNQNGVLAFDR